MTDDDIVDLWARDLAGADTERLLEARGIDDAERDEVLRLLERARVGLVELPSGRLFGRDAPSAPTGHLIVDEGSTT